MLSAHSCGRCFSSMFYSILFNAQKRPKNNLSLLETLNSKPDDRKGIANSVLYILWFGFKIIEHGIFRNICSWTQITTFTSILRNLPSPFYSVWQTNKAFGLKLWIPGHLACSSNSNCIFAGTKIKPSSGNTRTPLQTSFSQNTIKENKGSNFLNIFY
jgi:hypothetical protein